MCAWNAMGPTLNASAEFDDTIRTMSSIERPAPGRDHSGLPSPFGRERGAFSVKHASQPRTELTISHTPIMHQDNDSVRFDPHQVLHRVFPHSSTHYTHQISSHFWLPDEVFREIDPFKNSLHLDHQHLYLYREDLFERIFHTHTSTTSILSGNYHPTSI